jgi:hypothetical protein
MEHHDWDWSEGAGADGDAETADLTDGSDLGGFEHVGGFGEHFDTPAGDDLGGHDFPADVHHDGGIEEPLGTENATAHYDEALHEFAHDDTGHDPGHDPSHTDTTEHVDDHAGEHVEPHVDAVDTDHDTPDTGHPGDHAPGDHAPDNHAPDGHDPYADQHDTGEHAPEALVGTDPDLDHHADHADWHDDNPFPPGLDIHAPEPVDGFPWSDPSALGDGAAPDDYTHDYSHLVNTGDEGGPAHAADLAQYDGVEVPPGTDAWTHLLGSEDPATSALARWWSPGT